MPRELFHATKVRYPYSLPCSFRGLWPRESREHETDDSPGFTCATAACGSRIELDRCASGINSDGRKTARSGTITSVLTWRCRELAGVGGKRSAMLPMNGDVPYSVSRYVTSPWIARNAMGSRLSFFCLNLPASHVRGSQSLGTGCGARGGPRPWNIDTTKFAA